MSSSKSRTTRSAAGPSTEIRLPCTDDLLVGEGLLNLAQVLVAGAEQAGHEVVARDEALGVQRVAGSGCVVMRQ